MMEVYNDSQENEDQLRELKPEKTKFFVRVTKWIDWEYLPLKLFKQLFNRRNDNVDKD